MPAGLFSESKAPSARTEIKNEWIYTSASPMYLQDVDREIFIIVSRMRLQIPNVDVSEVTECLAIENVFL